MMIEEQNLIDKLVRIEALFAGATTSGEQIAAANALERIKNRLKQVQKKEPPVEYKFTLNNRWSRKLFVALLRRYDIKPYRYYRQRHTTVMAKVSERFVNETLWPQFEKLDETLTEYIDNITDRHQDLLLTLKMCRISKFVLMMDQRA